MSVMSEIAFNKSTLVASMIAGNNNRQSYVLVVGLGLTGMSSVRYLKTHGHNVMVADSRSQPPCINELKKDYPDVQLYTGEFDQKLFADADQMVVSPGVSLKEAAIQSAIAEGVEVLGDVELFARNVNAPVLAITGSNGKSTVTMLVSEMARHAGLNVAMGGNIGIPALDLLNQNADLYVLELSSFQLETLNSLKPVAATVLNVSPDHMDRYNSYNDYIKVKNKIYQHNKISIVNRDDQASSLVESAVQSCGFTLGEPVSGDFGVREYNAEMFLCKGSKKLISLNEMKLKGQHNVANALAALALCEAVNIPLPDMLQVLREFKGLPHRTQWLINKNGVDWYNDSKGTNVGATLAAVNGLQVKNKIILIAGGISKDANFEPLKEVVKNKTRLVILMGRDAAILERALHGTAPIIHAKDMSDAVNIAADKAQAGDSVLLSPACASFDMFDSFEQRGEIFCAAVEKLQ